MKRVFDPLTKSVVKVFPETSAIIHWGGAQKRKKISKSGDVDILIVVKGKTALRSEDVLKLKNAFKKIQLDPYVIKESDLGRKTITSLGPHGPCEMHELIHYQLKHESEVIFGDKKVLKSIAPMTLKAAMREIAPYVRDVMIPQLEGELRRRSAEDFIAHELSRLLVVVRTFYTVERGDIATKEQALKYLSDRHPELKLLSGVMLNKYLGKKTKPYPALKADLRKLLDLAKEV